MGHGECGLPGLEHDDLGVGRRPRPRDLNASRVGLDRRERVVVARDDLLGADELGGDDGVEAVHRVVAADAHERDVDLVAALARRA